MSKNNFLITGLPRSRTAWLAAVASGQKSICYHEPTPHLPRYEDLEALYSDDRFQYVGVSDSALILQIGRIMHDHKTRVLIVRRDPVECAESFLRYFPEDLGNFDAVGYCKTMEEHLLRYIAQPGVRYIHYEHLKNEGSVRQALAWLMPDARFPKLHEMMHMNVQVDRHYAARLVHETQEHNRWHLDRSWERPHEAAA